MLKTLDLLQFRHTPSQGKSINLEKSIETTKITKDTNSQRFVLKRPLTSHVNAQPSDFSLAMIAFVLFVSFVVPLNCGV